MQLVFIEAATAKTTKKKKKIQLRKRNCDRTVQISPKNKNRLEMCDRWYRSPNDARFKVVLLTKNAPRVKPIC